MRRPILEQGDAKVIIYASRAGQNITAMDLIKACENREAHMRGELQAQGKFVTKCDRYSDAQGDIILRARWVVYGVKQTKYNRKLNAGSAAPEPVLGRPKASEGVQADKGDDLGEGKPGERKANGPAIL